MSIISVTIFLKMCSMKFKVRDFLQSEKSFILNYNFQNTYLYQNLVMEVRFIIELILYFCNCIYNCVCMYKGM